METRADRPNGHDAGRRWQVKDSLILSLAADEAYGFTCRGCLGSTLSISIARSRAKVSLIAKAHYGFNPDVEVRKALTAAKWDRLQSTLQQTGFWSFPERYERYGLDGETWVLEGRRGDAYHRSWQWSPPAGAYRDLGLAFAELAGLGMPDDRP